MFLESFEKSLKSIIFNPITLLPMLLVSLLSYLSIQITSFVLERPLNEIILYQDTFMSGDLTWIIINRYLVEIFVALLSGFIILFLTIICTLAVANIAKGLKVSEAINKSFIEIKKSFFLTFFVFIISGLLFIFFIIIEFIFNFILSISPSEISQILSVFVFPISIIILLIILITKLGFVLPALIENKIRDAIKKSWEFTNKKFWISFITVIITFFIALLIVTICDLIGLWLGLGVIFWILGDAIALTFIVLNLSFYYFGNQ